MSLSTRVRAFCIGGIEPTPQDGGSPAGAFDSLDQVDDVPSATGLGADEHTSEPRSQIGRSPRSWATRLAVPIGCRLMRLPRRCLHLGRRHRFVLLVATARFFCLRPLPSRRSRCYPHQLAECNGRLCSACAIQRRSHHLQSFGRNVGRSMNTAACVHLNCHFGPRWLPLTPHRSGMNRRSYGGTAD
jgi:hypothetical protein